MKRIRHLPMYVCLVILTLAFIWGNSLVPGDVSGEISGGVFEMVAGLFAVFGDKGQLVLRKLAHLTEYTALGFFLTGLWRNLKRRERFTPPLLFGLAAACLDETITRTIAAQAADELINISGITASFVLFPDGEQVIISARSIGSCNVQVVLEKLGGGGNGATAGAQIKGKPLRQTTVMSFIRLRISSASARSLA